MRTSLSWIIVFGLVAIFSAKLITDRDLGFHLRSGEWMANHLSFPTTGVFSYAVPDRPFVNLYWCFEMAVYGLYNVGGYAAIGLMQTLMVLAIFFVFKQRLAMLPRALALWATIAAVIIMEGRMNHRPEVWSWLFLVLLLFQLDRFCADRSRSLWLLPAIMLIWVNSHAHFILGVIVIVAYSVTFWKQGWLTRKSIVPLTVSLGTSLVNPFGMTGAVYPLTLLTWFDSDYHYRASVSELTSPWSTSIRTVTGIPAEALYLFYALVIVSVIVLFVRAKFTQPHEWILVATFVYLSSVQVRNASLTPIVLLPIVLRHMHELRLYVYATFINLPWFALAGVVAILIGLRVGSGAYYTADDRAESVGYGLMIPTETEDRLASLSEGKKVLNNPNAGNWLNWRFKQSVYISTYFALTGEHIFDEYHSNTRPGKLSRLISRYRPDWIIFDHHSDLGWTLDLAADSDWQLLVWDSRTACYAPARSIKDDTLPRVEPLDSTEVWTILRSQPPEAVFQWLRGFFTTRTLPWREVARGQFEMAVGQYAHAEQSLLQALKLAPQRSETYKDLGILYYFLNDRRKSRYCFARYLDKYPNDPQARKLFETGI